MRIALLSTIVLVATAGAGAQGPAVPPTGTATDDEVRARLAADLVRKEAEEYRITVGEGQRPLTLESGPILKTSSPVLGQLHGGVFLWTDRGRPEVIAHIYKWYSPHKYLGVAFHSLGREPPSAERAGELAWSPDRGGVELKPVPDAPPPADSAPARLRQMRALAEEFSANHTYPGGITRELRLLTKPLYRYANPQGDILDGVLFAFALGTDPEVFLILEAHRDERGRPGWQYGLSRDTVVAARAAHKGREVWSVPLIPLGPGSKFYDPREPYMEMVFDPGQGHNPPEPAK